MKILRQSLLAGCMALAAVSQHAALVLKDTPLLFVDDVGVEKRLGIVRTPHAARTRAEPVLSPDRAWEGDRVYVYGSIYRNPAGAGYQLWYMSRPARPVAGSGTGIRTKKGQVPGFRDEGADLVLYATSPDGVTWDKPALGLHAHAGSVANNIVYDLHSPSVLFDPQEKDPAKRYKMLGCWNKNYHAAYSEDGIRWSSYPKSAVLPHSDTVTLAQDPRTGEYLAFHKRPTTVRGMERRVVWLARSSDFQNWSEPELVFVPDEADDAWATRPDQRMEVYDMAVYPHAGGFIGLPAMFRVLQDRPRAEMQLEQGPHDGPIDIQLVSSADGRSWQRSWPRIAVIPRGKPGSFDGGAILGVSSTMVDAGDETWVYYTAMNTGHGGPMPPKRLTIGRAEWRRHGFVSLDAGPEGGRVETVALQLTSPTLWVNADAGAGEVRIALLETDGRPIPGFTADESIPLVGDHTRWAARWSHADAVPTDRPVRVVLEMRSTRFYSLSSARD